MSSQEYLLLYGFVQILRLWVVTYCPLCICFLNQRGCGLYTWSIYLGITALGQRKGCIALWIHTLDLQYLLRYHSCCWEATRMTSYGLTTAVAPVLHTIIYSPLRSLLPVGWPPLRAALSLSITFISCEKQARAVLQGEQAGF